MLHTPPLWQMIKDQVTKNILLFISYFVSIQSLGLSFRGFPSFSSWSNFSSNTNSYTCSNRGGYFAHDNSLRVAHDGMLEDGTSEDGTVFLASTIHKDQIVDVD